MKRKNENFTINFDSHRYIVYFNYLVEKTQNVPGVICECGVGAGFSLFSLMCSEYRLASIGNREMRDFFAFDSFEGFPGPTEHDGDIKAGLRKGRGWLLSNSSLEEKLSSAGVPTDKINMSTI